MDNVDRKKIEALEQQILSEKPWQLKGEVSARFRPINSLLYEDVDFQQHIKAPNITPETTETLEELIKQRIKDNKFDDPVRKVKQIGQSVTKPPIEINSEKSKVGLAQLYEQELIAKASSSKQVKDGPEKDVERKLNAILRKLDALCVR